MSWAFSQSKSTLYSCQPFFRETLALLEMSFSWRDAPGWNLLFFKYHMVEKYVITMAKNTKMLVFLPWLRRFFVTGCTVGLSRDLRYDVVHAWPSFDQTLRYGRCLCTLEPMSTDWQERRKEGGLVFLAGVMHQKHSLQKTHQKHEYVSHYNNNFVCLFHCLTSSWLRRVVSRRCCLDS